MNNSASLPDSLTKSIILCNTVNYANMQPDYPSNSSLIDCTLLKSGLGYFRSELCTWLSCVIQGMADKWAYRFAGSFH